MSDSDEELVFGNMKNKTKKKTILDEKEEQEKDQEKDQEQEEDQEQDQDQEQEEELIVEEAPPDELILKLGDVIVIQSPSDYILDKKIFYIDYIDNQKIKIINVDDFSTTSILINSDGTIADNNINSITIISSNPNKGYARQNNLLPNTWIDIFFGGDIPTIITGQITNLEDDMIEIKTVDKNVLYINFNYQGIPENLPPLSFEIREKPTSLRETQKSEINIEEKIKSDTSRLKPVKSDRIILADNDFVIGDIVQIEEIINVDETMRRFNIEEQTNDFFENLVSTIPNNKRNSTIINEFNTIVKRFVELRQMSSIFDKYGNVEGSIIHSPSDIPLADYLSEFRNKLYWIKYGVINNREIYDNLDKTSIDVSNIKRIFKQYSKGDVGTDQNNYYKLFNTLNPYVTPFNPVDVNEYPNVFSKPEGLIISRQIGDEVYTIDNTMSDVTSQVCRKNKVTNRQYVMQQYNTGLDWFVTPTLSKGGRMIGKKEKMTPNETIHVNSIFTLPEPVVRFSQINLPNSNLLVKSNLNHLFVNYFQLINKTTPIKNIILNDLENVPEIISDTDDYLNDELKKFTLNLSAFDQNAEISDMTIFHQFIKLIVPSTSILFKLINKYIHGTLSPQNAILYLEPFMIYSNDLTFTQFKNIAEFVKNKIYEYNDMFSKYEEIFNIIKNKNSNENIFTSNLYNLLNDLKPEAVKNKTIKAPSMWTERMSTKYNRLYWQNSITGESVWEKPVELEEKEKDEEPEIQIGFFNEDMKSKMIDMYKLSNTNMSSSEFITKIISRDYGNLFSSLIAYTNLKLMFSSKLNKLFEEEKELLKQIIETDRTKNTCKTYVIAKKYYSYEKLIADNDIDVYFDKEYDSTNYDIIDEKFKKEQTSMTKEEFREFLMPQLKKIYKLSDENASYLAETLTNGLKKVLNGHYALLSIVKDEIQTMSYYMRQDDMWVEANQELNLSSFIKDDDVLCNINYDCLYDNAEKTEGKCLSNEINQDNAIERQFKGILDQFDENYEFSMEELTTLIKNKILFNENKFNVLNNYYTNEFLKYNNNAYKLGKSLDKNGIISVISPYAKLRDMILGQNDYAKKQQNIIMFIDKYCRKGISSSINPVTKENESEWWFYCRDTNVPLIPYFRHELAKIFLENPQEYQNVLEKIIKEIGKQSDDGDSWVDKHSGEVICKIDFDISEGFKDGFVNKSRDIIEASTDEIVAENLTNKQLSLSFKADDNTIYLNDIINVLEGALGVQLKEHKEFMLKIGTSLLRAKSSDNAGILLTRKEYTENMSKKTDKKIPSYELYYSVKVMYLALGLFAIGLQITIPSIKTRKIAPRCTKSFQGYPLGDSTDNSFIKYIACVIKQHRSDTVPWMAIEKDEDRMVPLIIKNLDEYLIPNIEMRQKIIKKIEYLNAIQSKYIPDEYNVAKWSNFLPPLRKFHIKSDNKNSVDDNFLDDLKKNILNSNSKQEIQINVIHSKIIYQSLAIQEEIQKIIDKKELMMKSSISYHMVNSCCNNITDNITALQYFISESPFIENYNNDIKKMSNYLTYINNLSKSSIYISDINTKSVFPDIPNIFSEEIIYRGFITYCKFNTLGGLSKELLDICIEKPNYNGKGRSIQEQIFQLKKLGKEYTIDDFLKLYKVVSKNNIINVDLNKRESSISELIKYVNILKSEPNLNALSKKIIDDYALLIDSDNFYQLYENDTDIMKNIKNKLEIQNDALSNEIIKYLESNKSTSSMKILNSVKSFIQNLRFSKWKFNMTSRNNANNISNDKLYNYNKYISNFVELFSNTLPEVIINKKKHTLIPHKYWKLSSSHEDMITKSVEKYYSQLNKFYDNLALSSFLSIITDICKPIMKLCNLTSSMTNITKDVVFKHSLDEEISSFLYEYYLLCVLKSYMILSNSEIPYIDKSGDEQLSDILTNKKNVSQLFIAYIGFMIDSKHEVNISYEIVFDNIFKNQEFEKNLVTDRLANMTQEERDVDTTLKGLKLGMYGIGQSKALRFYDQDQFEEDKKRNEDIAKLEKKSKKQLADDVELDDEQYNENVDADEAEELRMNENEDYYDGDPYGDEHGNDEW
jgi:hypothetical protein